MDDPQFIKPFCGLRPLAERVADVIAPPYDVIEREQARVLAKNNPHSFLHIAKPEIDLPDTVDAYDSEVYQLGAQHFQQWQQRGLFIHDMSPSYYGYQIQVGDHIQTGLVAIASVSAYQQQRIMPHELTRPVKEDDRVNNILALQAQTSPVLTLFRQQTALANIVRDFPGELLYEVNDQQQVTHRLSHITSPDLITTITQAANQLDTLYIADGHHRSAAAARVHAQLKTPASGYFLTVLFPDNELHVEGYHRVVNDIAPYQPAQLLTALADSFAVTPTAMPTLPLKPYQFAMYLANKWYHLSVKQKPAADPIQSLDVSVLTDAVLQPLFHITDQRNDPRLHFIGGEESLAMLMEQVHESVKPAVGFVLPPTQIQQLLTVADNHQLMPPKSTWFSPKLVDGLVSYLLEEKC